MKTTEVAIVVTLVALCVATNYALIGVYQVKVMDFIVFVGGFCFGPLIGALIGFLPWTIYGALNPLGFVPQIWLATITMESIYGVVGGFLGRSFVKTGFREQRLQFQAFFSAVGFLSTLPYDLVLSSVFALVSDMPVFVAIIYGTPFHIVHEISNAAIFGFASVPLLPVIRKMWSAKTIGLSTK